MEALSKSQEDYLETILLLTLQKGAVRSVDIAETLSFSKPSISRAVSLLKKEGYITVHEDHCIELTDEGRDRAQRVYSKHCILRRFLLIIGMDKKKAEEDACEIEHILSEDTCGLIEQFLAANGY